MAFVVQEEHILRWLTEGGIDIRSAKRVVIDIQVGNAAKVYIDMYGSEALLKVTPPGLSCAEVIRLDNPDDLSREPAHV